MPFKFKTFIIPFLFFSINLLLKLLFVSSNDIAIDEPFSIFYAQMNLDEIGKMLVNENNPPLHFALLHFWIKLFGISPFSVRFLSVFFSALTVPVIYAIGNQYFSKKTGILSGIIFTLSNFHIYFSHEARVYPIFIFLTATSLYYFLSIVNNPKKRISYILLLITNIFIIYAHYFGFFVIACEFISIFMVINFRKIWKNMFVLFSIILVSYIPNIIIFITRFTTTTTNGTWVPKPKLSELYGNLNRFLNTKQVMFILLVIVLTYLIVQIRAKKILPKAIDYWHNSSFRVIGVWFLFPYLCMFIASYWIPMFLDRYILYISIPFYLIISFLLIDFIENRPLKFAAIFLFVGGMIYTFEINPSNKRCVKDVINTVNELKQVDSSTVILISPDYAQLEFAYHYNMNYFKDYNNTTKLLNTKKIYPMNNFDLFDQKEITHSKVIYLDCGYEFAFGNNPLLSNLKTSHILMKVIPIFEIYQIYWFYPNVNSPQKSIHFAL